MCGFAGFVEIKGLASGAESDVRAMSATLVHRGPDDDDIWLDPDAGVALAFRRLSILDLSEAGRQPMTSASGRFVLVFNGEIYNHLDLRTELSGSGPVWRGHSDTETLLAACERWGVRETLRRAVGMFSFALWDRRSRTLTLARDRLGEKPLHYGWHAGRLLFASELKALRAHPGYRPGLDRASVAAYLRHGYVPAPATIYQGIHKLQPGTLMTWTAAELERAEVPSPTPYWSLLEAARAGTANPFEGDDEDAVDALEQLLAQAVELQRVADVPLGAFLSGGIDSSAVVSLMQANSHRPVRTFTIGFDEVAYDESSHARTVAKHLGTDHTELRVTPVEAMAVIQDLPRLYDEPFGDASAIPTYLVARLARRHVTVALSGDGGDELFAGYYRYRHTHRVWSGVQRLPAVARSVAGPLAATAERALAWAPGANAGGRVLVRQRFGTLRAAVADTIAPLYKEHMSLWREPERALRSPSGETPSVLSDGDWPLAHQSIDHMTYTDTLSYLPDDILVKVDRAAMAVSLETRVPLLDHRVVEFSWRLAPHFKVREGETKWLLRRVLERHVPRAIFERPKMGFGVPIDQWMRGPLRPWAEELLASDRLKRDGLLQPQVIRGRWIDHLSGNRDWQYSLWPVLVFQAWLESERASAP